MRLKHIKDADKIIMSSPYLVKNPCEYKGKWNKFFGNDNKIEIEVGTGKGKFIISKALENPNTNYIGIEKYDSPLVSAVKKLETLHINNLKLICFDAFNINDVFDHEIDKIYLNFSDPWPKDRHAKRRLTSINYLQVYDKLFKGKPHIIQKTDNDLLFQFSLDEYQKYGYHINRISYDLHNEDIPNVMTEYEEKFSNMGIKIKYVDVSK